MKSKAKVSIGGKSPQNYYCFNNIVYSSYKTIFVSCIWKICERWSSPIERYDSGGVLFHTRGRVLSEQQLVQSTYHKFFSTEVVPIISAYERQRRQDKEKGKLDKVEHAREKEKIGGTAGNESCTCMILEASLQARHLFKGLLPSSFIARKQEPRIELGYK